MVLLKSHALEPGGKPTKLVVRGDPFVPPLATVLVVVTTGARVGVVVEAGVLPLASGTAAVVARGEAVGVVSDWERGERTVMRRRSRGRGSSIVVRRRRRRGRGRGRRRVSTVVRGRRGRRDRTAATVATITTTCTAVLAATLRSRPAVLIAEVAVEIRERRALAARGSATKGSATRSASWAAAERAERMRAAVMSVAASDESLVQTMGRSVRVESVVAKGRWAKRWVRSPLMTTSPAPPASAARAASIRSHSKRASKVAEHTLNDGEAGSDIVRGPLRRDVGA